MILPKAYKHEAEFAAEVAEVEQQLRPEVVRICFYLQDDATGDPAVFFLVLLSNEASRYEVLSTNTRHIENEIERKIQPLWNWARPELRARLGRAYEHGLMKSASGRLIAELQKDSAMNS